MKGNSQRKSEVSVPAHLCRQPRCSALWNDSGGWPPKGQGKKEATAHASSTIGRHPSALSFVVPARLYQDRDSTGASFFTH